MRIYKCGMFLSSCVLQTKTGGARIRGGAPLNYRPAARRDFAPLQHSNPYLVEVADRGIARISASAEHIE